MENFKITYKVSQRGKMQITDVRANGIKEAVQKLKELHQNVVVSAFMQM
ncbi:MAG: hypothetical protein WC665_05210 [Sulfurimonas sp.]